MSNDGFGTARLDGGSARYKFFRPQTGKNGEETHNKFRLMPPIKSGIDRGLWSLYQSQHYGYKVKDSNDPDKLRNRTFKCVEVKNFKTKMIEVTCPECIKIEEQKALKKRHEEQQAAAGKTPEEISVLIRPINQWLKDHNRDSKHYINAMNEENEFGVLLISHKAFVQLKAKIKDLAAKGIDAFHPDQGVWFDIVRTGKGVGANGVVDVVEIVYTEVRDSDGDFVKKLKLAPLSEDQKKQALETCPDLNEVLREITREQVALLVDSSGDPDEVEAVFNMGQTREESSPRERSVGAGPVRTETVTKPTPIASVATTPPTTEMSELDRLRAQVAALKAANKVTEVQKPKAESVQLIAPDEELDDDAFLERFANDPSGGRV